MSRSKRLFDLLQALRRRRTAVSGLVLAQELGVSLRTIRRDVATLQSLGAEIQAEAGVGYALRPGLLLPPLAFTEEELHALALGAELISQQTDVALSSAVRNAVAKIEAVLVPHMHHALDGTSFYVAPTQIAKQVTFELAELRRALREQRKLQVRCKGQDGILIEKIVWPIMLGFTANEQSFAGWCETNAQYEIFAPERIVHVEVLAETYPRDRRQMVKEWRVLAADFCSQRSIQ